MHIDTAMIELFWHQEGDLVLEERVYRFLHDRIVQGDAVPGSAIVGNRIAKHLGVSRITVTSALKRLSSEGFVVVHPHRGATVASLNLATLNEILRIRYALESEVMTELASNLDDGGLAKLYELDDNVRQSLLQNDTRAYRQWERRFHLLVYELSGLPMIASYLTDLWNRIEPYRGRRYTSQLLVQEAMDDHRRVLEAVATRDAASAVSAMKAHIARGHNHLLHVFADQPESDDARTVNTASLPATIPQDGPPPGSLGASFAALADSRRGQGRMYTQHGVLTLAVCAMLCGARSQYAIAAWIRDAACSVREGVGWPGERIPSPPTIHRVLSRVDSGAFADALGRWLAQHRFGTDLTGPWTPASGIHGERPIGVDVVERLAARLYLQHASSQHARRKGDGPAHWDRFFGTLLYGERLPPARSPAEQHLWMAFLHVAGRSGD